MLTPLRVVLVLIPQGGGEYFFHICNELLYGAQIFEVLGKGFAMAIPSIPLVFLNFLL